MKIKRHISFSLLNPKFQSISTKHFGPTVLVWYVTWYYVILDGAALFETKDNKKKSRKEKDCEIYIVLKYKFLPENTSKPLIVSGFIDETSWYSYFYKSTLIEFSQFFSKLIVTKTETNVRQQVLKDGYSVFVQKKR